jgi:hypothetical protein
LRYADGPGVLRQHVEADPVQVRVFERVVDQRPNRVLPESLAPELPADADAELACAAEVVDPVEPGLPDQLAVHLDPEIGTILVVLRQILIEARLELRERAGDDRPRTPEDRDVEVRQPSPSVPSTGCEEVSDPGSTIAVWVRSCTCPSGAGAASGTR